MEKVTDQERIAQIRERAEKATKGPWATISKSTERDPGCGISSQIGDGTSFRVANIDIDDLELDEQNLNADFIAHARTDIPFLLDKLAAERDDAKREEREAAQKIARLATCTHEGCDTIDILRCNIERLGAEVIEAYAASLAAELQAARLGKEEALLLASDQVKEAVKQGFQLRRVGPDAFEWKNTRAERAEAELTRMRGALQKIADNYGGCHCDHTDDNCCEHPSVGEFCPHCIAETALASLTPTVAAPSPASPQPMSTDVIKAATELLDAMETCHICKCALVLEESPVHCEDCSGDCENHDEPECTPIYVLHARLRKALAAHPQEPGSREDQGTGDAPEPDSADYWRSVAQKLAAEIHTGKVFIGDLRRELFMPYDCKWNGYIRDVTAELEQPGGRVPRAEVYAKINRKGAELVALLELRADLSAIGDGTDWVSVEERLPEFKVEVLVWAIGTKSCREWVPRIATGQRVRTDENGDVWFATWHSVSEEGYNVTHWQPLPAPPSQSATKEKL